MSAPKDIHRKASITIWVLFLGGMLGITLLPPLHDATTIYATSLEGAAFRNPDLPIDVRLDDLMSRLTLQEKISMLLTSSPAIARLGIKRHYVGNEALHGIVRPGKFTVFPQAIGLAATFDPELVYQMADYATDEARARHNADGGEPEGYYSGLLTFFSPNINMARDPRWGRTPETYGEDPWLTSRMAVAFVKGLQGTTYDQPRNYSQQLKAVATPKHFACNNEESWLTPEGIRRERFSLSADMPEQWLRDYYLPQFRAAVVEAGAECVMSAYNAINGTPCCANERLLTDILRGEWNFQGYVVTDCGGIGLLKDGHHYVSSYPEAAAAAIKSGVDLECDNKFVPNVMGAICSNILSPADVEQAARRVLEARFHLGLFDPPEDDVYGDLNETVIACDEHAALALDLAEKSLVLLKNEKVAGTPLLPFNTTTVNTIAVIGPGANVAKFGGYSGEPVRTAVTPFAGINARGVLPGITTTTVQYDPSGDHAADIQLATDADVTVVVLGLGGADEEEGRDRTSLDLPADQVSFLQAVLAANPNTVVLLNGGSSITMDSWLANVKSLVQIWYPGEAGGTAIAKILFGDTNPSGRLPLTFYKSVDDLPRFDDYDISKNRTYMFQDAPLFPFGFGLSYTNFTYADITLNQTTVGTNGTIGVSLNMTNTGIVNGDEVVQLYVRKAGVAGPSQPKLQLKGFKRVAVPAGTTVPVTIPVAMKDIATWSITARDYIVVPGTYEILAAASATDIRLITSFTVSA